MADFPYTNAPAKIKPVLDKIHDVGIPSVVNLKWLETMGFKSKADRTLIGLLKSIGFLNGTAPTSVWKDYRDKNKRAAVLGIEIQKAYRALFDTYPDAQKRSDDEIRNYFKTHSGHGDEMVRLYVSSFKNLCANASFEGSALEHDDSPPPTVTFGVAGKGGVTPSPQNASQPFTVNINIQLTLPDSTDAKGYDAFFAAMKTHLFPSGK